MVTHALRISWAACLVEEVLFAQYVESFCQSFAHKTKELWGLQRIYIYDVWG